MNEKEIARIMKRKKVDILVLSQNESVLLRIQDLALRFRFISQSFARSADYIENFYDYSKAAVVLLEDPNDVPKLAEVSKTSALILLVEKAIPTEEVQILHEKGLYAVIAKYEFLSTPKFDFVCLQKIRAAYYPISLQDVYPSTEMSFHASVRLPLNQKYLPVIFKGFLLTESKFKKIEKEGRLFIKNHQSPEYLGYINHYNDSLGAGLRKRCRAQFLVLSYQLLALFEHLIFDSERDRSVSQNELFVEIQKTLGELNDYMGRAGDVDLWDVFKDALVNEIFNHWRAPWLVVYSGLLCHETKQGDPLVAMTAACLADLGLMDLTPDLFFNFVHEGEKSLKPEQLSELSKHPILSLNRCLGRGLPLSESVKAVIVCTHERQDQKGYPNQTPPEHIPFEAWVIQFAEKIDFGVSSLALGPNVSFKFLRQVVWERSVQPSGAFPAEVVEVFHKIVEGPLS